MSKLDDAMKRYGQLLRNVRPTELRSKLNDAVVKLMEATAEEATAKSNTENALSALLKGIKTNG